ncbi:hypothetical protein BGX31_005617 [Mortierella sp. GBA43]|nr:hypothetical protein BGX31_005617 [Mortierella sp. GBA43]
MKPNNTQTSENVAEPAINATNNAPDNPLDNLVDNTINNATGDVATGNVASGATNNGTESTMEEADDGDNAFKRDAFNWTNYAHMERYHTLDYNPRQDHTLYQARTTQDNGPSSRMPEARGSSMYNTNVTPWMQEVISLGNPSAVRALEPFHYYDLVEFDARYHVYNHWKMECEKLSIRRNECKLQLEGEAELLRSSIQQYKEMVGSINSLEAQLSTLSDVEARSECENQINAFKDKLTRQEADIRTLRDGLQFPLPLFPDTKPPDLDAGELSFLEDPSDETAYEHFIELYERRPEMITEHEYAATTRGYESELEWMKHRAELDRMDLDARMQLYTMAHQVASSDIGKGIRRLKKLASPISLEVFNTDNVCHLQRLSIDSKRMGWRETDVHPEWRMNASKNAMPEKLKENMKRWHQLTELATRTSVGSTRLPPPPQRLANPRYIDNAMLIISRNLETLEHLRWTGPGCRCADNPMDPGQHECDPAEPPVLDCNEIISRHDEETNKRRLGNPLDPGSSAVNISNDYDQRDSFSNDGGLLGIHGNVSSNLVVLCLDSWTILRSGLRSLLERCPCLIALSLRNCILTDIDASVQDRCFQHDGLRSLTASFTTMYSREHRERFRDTITRIDQQPQSSTATAPPDDHPELSVIDEDHPSLFIHFPNLERWTVAGDPHSHGMARRIKRQIHQYARHVHDLGIEEGSMTTKEAETLIQIFNSPPMEGLSVIRAHSSFSTDSVLSALEDHSTTLEVIDFDPKNEYWAERYRRIHDRDGEDEAMNDPNGEADSEADDNAEDNDGNNDDDDGDDDGDEGEIDVDSDEYGPIDDEAYDGDVENDSMESENHYASDSGFASNGNSSQSSTLVPTPTTGSLQSTSGESSSSSLFNGSFSDPPTTLSITAPPSTTSALPSDSTNSSDLSTSGPATSSSNEEVLVIPNGHPTGTDGGSTSSNGGPASPNGSSSGHDGDPVGPHGEPIDNDGPSSPLESLLDRCRGLRIIKIPQRDVRIMTCLSRENPLRELFIRVRNLVDVATIRRVLERVDAISDWIYFQHHETPRYDHGISKPDRVSLKDHFDQHLGIRYHPLPPAGDDENDLEQVDPEPAVWTDADSDTLVHYLRQFDRLDCIWLSRQTGLYRIIRLSTPSTPSPTFSSSPHVSEQDHSGSQPEDSSDVSDIPGCSGEDTKSSNQHVDTEEPEKSETSQQNTSSGSIIPASPSWPNNLSNNGTLFTSGCSGEAVNDGDQHTTVKVMTQNQDDVEMEGQGEAETTRKDSLKRKKEDGSEDLVEEEEMDNGPALRHRERSKRKEHRCGRHGAVRGQKRCRHS